MLAKIPSLEHQLQHLFEFDQNLELRKDLQVLHQLLQVVSQVLRHLRSHNLHRLQRMMPQVKQLPKGSNQLLRQLMRG